jgi:ADP-ribose pyrophosphatase YjhB (NUDIX family)
VVWENGHLPLRITGYLSDELPPLDYVTSVRTLVFQGGALLVMRNRDGLHILPGGRREAGETLEHTLAREVLEETGWTLGRRFMLGFMHFHHLAPKPPDYAYPHPDFLWVIYAAEAETFVPGAKRSDDYELEASLRPIAEVQALPLEERFFLEAALSARAERSLAQHARHGDQTRAGGGR